MVAIDLPLYIKHCAPNVAVNTMVAIVKTESNGNTLALGLNNGKKLKFQPRNYEQAVAWIIYLDKHGYNFDVGLGQINIRNIKKYGYKAIDMLEPCKNLNLASLILKKNFTGALLTSTTSKEALHKAISAYNTGNYHSGFSNGYVQRVLNNANLMDYALNVPSVIKNFDNDGNTILSKNSKNSKYRAKNNFSTRTLVYAKSKSELQSSTTKLAQNN